MSRWPAWRRERSPCFRSFASSMSGANTNAAWATAWTTAPASYHTKPCWSPCPPWYAGSTAFQASSGPAGCGLAPSSVGASGGRPPPPRAAPTASPNARSGKNGSHRRPADIARSPPSPTSPCAARTVVLHYARTHVLIDAPLTPPVSSQLPGCSPSAYIGKERRHAHQRRRPSAPRLAATPRLLPSSRRDTPISLPAFPLPLFRPHFAATPLEFGHGDPCKELKAERNGTDHDSVPRCPTPLRQLARRLTLPRRAAYNAGERALQTHAASPPACDAVCRVFVTQRSRRWPTVIP
jgi:hypothetical protein